MLVPVYGHRTRFVSDGKGGIQEMKDASRKPVGILQFINKKNDRAIDDYDVEKIKALAPLLG